MGDVNSIDAEMPSNDGSVIERAHGMMSEGRAWWDEYSKSGAKLFRKKC